MWGGIAIQVGHGRVYQKCAGVGSWHCPAHGQFRDTNPALQARNHIFFQLNASTLARGQGPRRAAVNSFGYWLAELPTAS